MNSRLLKLLAVFGILCFFPSFVFAQLFHQQTKNLQLIYYSKAHEYLTPHIVGCFENALRFERTLFDYTSSERVTVLLQDFGDYASGAANTVPFNLISVGIEPFSYVYETMPAEERMSLMMMHELVHVITMDKASPRDAFFRSLFLGKVAPIADQPLSMVYGYLTGPRWYSPRWFVESIAVFLETWMAGGLGRALGAYDEMVFRTMVRDSSYIYDVVGLESEGTKVDFQVGAASYLYGTRFISYLALRYGPEKLLEWFTQGKGTDAYFSTQFVKVYGTALDEEWQRWISWEREWQRENLDSLRRYPVTEFRRLTPNAVGSVSRAFYDDAGNALLVAVNSPGQTPHLVSINIATGETTFLHDIRGGALFYVTSLCYDPASRTLFFTTDNNHWRDLYAFDLASGTSRLLLKDARTGDLAFNRADRSLWGVRHFNGISTLVRFPYPYHEWNQVYSFDYGKDMFDIDISPDGALLIGALAHVDGSQSLISMQTGTLLAGDSSYETLYDFGNSTPANFVFAPGGQRLYGSSYYSGVSNIVRYDMASKTMHWVTNGETGFFRPVPLTRDSLIAFCFTARGFEPVMVAESTVTDINAIRYLGQAVVEKYPQLRSWALPPPSTINVDAATESRGEYRPMKNIRLASLYPIVEGYKLYPAYGLRLNLSEPLFLHRIDVTGSYTPNSSVPVGERFHAAFNYDFWEWGIHGTYNRADFYDLFGPTRTSRKGYSLRADYKNFWTFEEPERMELSASLGGYWGLERLPEYQNIAVTSDKFYSLDGTMTYSLVQKSLGAVDDESGIEWKIASINRFVQRTLYPRVYCTLALGTLLPIDHSSVWIRGALGYSPGNRSEPLSNFYFGGFGNNWVDHREIRRYREYYAFPGTELNALPGTNFGKLLVEWVLPPVRFRRLGGEALYCNWLQCAVFSNGIVTDIDAAASRHLALDVGAQVDFRLVFFSALESTFSLGYAAAVEKNQRGSREFMISLKILR